ncbi:flagellar biosynthesis anti-sigma factor FlgM [Thorsellia kenyensis]|uniref:Negative regulator of flagellin synthesis n=1 Tax=Thorsellia kenyensis TaxID=1549888 RepID=A0ABV6CBS9_9GAMM
MALQPLDSIATKITTNTSSTLSVRTNAPSDIDKELKKIATPLAKKEGAAEVTISNSALNIKSSENDINIEKVEQIKLAIKNGELTMDASKIADKLIAEISSNF